MIAPVAGKIEIVSPWGSRTLPNINGGKPHFHAGVDIRAPKGTEIVTPCRCHVLRFGCGNYGENFTVLQSLDTQDVFKVMHSHWMTDAKEGREYLEGETVAISDGSGTDAAHLHFETWKGGRGWAECGGVNYDPLEWFLRWDLPYVKRF